MRSKIQIPLDSQTFQTQYTSKRSLFNSTKTSTTNSSHSAANLNTHISAHNDRPKQQLIAHFSTADTAKIKNKASVINQAREIIEKMNKKISDEQKNKRTTEIKQNNQKLLLDSLNTLKTQILIQKIQTQPTIKKNICNEEKIQGCQKQNNIHTTQTKTVNKLKIYFHRNSSQNDEFQVIKYLSQGVCGKVYLVSHVLTQTIYSMKIIPKEKIKSDNISQLTRQLKIQTYLNHPNIVKLYAFHIDNQNIYLLLEPCLGEDLFSILKKNKDGLPEDEVKRIIKQVGQAVKFMHMMDIIHRDLKPENILFHQGIIKICDFGWAVHSKQLRKTRCGTPLYISPQIVRLEEYSSKIDIWNIGILTYQILYGTIPFQIRRLEDLSKIVDQKVYYPQSKPVSEYARDFMQGCLQKQQSSRYQIHQIVEHQFLFKLERYRWTIM